MNETSIILITGGARGITASVALELAQRYRPTLVLLGRSPLPSEEEPEDSRLLNSPAEIKTVLLTRMRREGRPATPVAVEAAYQRLIQDRAIRTNLSALRQAGARVHYHSVDVRDEAAFIAVLDEVERRFGGIDAVIHGAGVIHDKLVGDKMPETFNRVFDTKVESAFILARRLRPERLKLCVFFGSVAGRFGNRGQCDYAAANEVLAKLAIQLDRLWPGRVTTIVWGPWSGVGMGADVADLLRSRGLELIPPEVGSHFFEAEVRQGRKGEPEVVIAGEVGQLALGGARQLKASVPQLPEEKGALGTGPDGKE